jgi:hypothetical protein
VAVATVDGEETVAVVEAETDPCKLPEGGAFG